MKLAKQILSAILCTSVLSSCMMTTFAANVTQVEPEPNTFNEVCPGSPKDDKGRYFDLSCEQEKNNRKIKKGAGYITQTKLGIDKKYDLYIFDYISIVSFVREISRVAEANSNDLVINEILSETASKIKTLFGLSLSEAEEVVSILYVRLKGNANNSIPAIIKSPASKGAVADNKSIRNWGWKGAVGGALIAGGATAAVVILFPPAATVVVSALAKAGASAIGAAVGAAGGATAAAKEKEYQISNAHYQEYKKNRVLVLNCISAIDQILSIITSNLWQYKDSISIIFCNEDFNYHATVSNNKIGINYSEQQVKDIKESFENKAKELKVILDKYDNQ